MTKTILELLLGSMSIFSDERRRHFSKELLKFSSDLDEEKAKVYPEYSDARIARAKKDLDNFTAAYAKEFSTGLSALLAKVPNE